jgi:uncharacterized protein YjbI with pentapeptide repeats
LKPEGASNGKGDLAEVGPADAGCEAKREVQLVLTPDLEARFIEQEHRIVRVVQNYFDRKRWPVDDPRRVAARNAVVWRVLTPGTAAVATGGLLAIATLVVLVWQTRLIGEQNEFFRDQNQKLQMQIDQQADQDASRRRTEIFGVLYETQPGPEGVLVPKANPRTRGEAVLEFVQLERARLKKLRSQTKTPVYQRELSLTQARLDGLNLDRADLERLVLVGAFLQNTSFADTNLQFADLRAAQMISTSFAHANLQHSNFEGSVLLQASFAHSDLREANLSKVSLRGCEFLGADLREARVTVRDLDARTSFRYANIARADMDSQIREQALKQGAVELADDAKWEAFKLEKFPRN